MKRGKDTRIQRKKMTGDEAKREHGFGGRRKQVRRREWEEKERG